MATYHLLRIYLRNARTLHLCWFVVNLQILDERLFFPNDKVFVVVVHLDHLHGFSALFLLLCTAPMASVDASPLQILKFSMTADTAISRVCCREARQCDLEPSLFALHTKMLTVGAPCCRGFRLTDECVYLFRMDGRRPWSQRQKGTTDWPSSFAPEQADGGFGQRVNVAVRENVRRVPLLVVTRVTCFKADKRRGHRRRCEDQCSRVFDVTASDHNWRAAIHSVLPQTAAAMQNVHCWIVFSLNIVHYCSVKRVRLPAPVATGFYTGISIGGFDTTLRVPPKPMSWYRSQYIAFTICGIRHGNVGKPMRVCHNIAFVTASLMESLHVNAAIVVSADLQVRKSRGMLVDLWSSCQSAMMLQGEGLGIVEIWLDYTKGREREAKFRKMHSPQEMPKEVSNKSYREWCKNFSDVDSLQKLFQEKIPLQVSTSPRLHGCSKYAYNVQQKLLPQHFHTRKNSLYARSPMRFQQRFAYNASSADVDIEPPCWRARQNELTNHGQAIDPNDESAIHTRSHGGQSVSNSVGHNAQVNARVQLMAHVLQRKMLSITIFIVWKSSCFPGAGAPRALSQQHPTRVVKRIVHSPAFSATECLSMSASTRYPFAGSHSASRRLQFQKHHIRPFQKVLHISRCLLATYSKFSWVDFHNGTAIQPKGQWRWSTVPNAGSNMRLS